MDFFEPGRPIVLAGAGVYGKRVMERISENDRRQVYAFTDSNPEKVGAQYCGKPVISLDETREKQQEYRIILAVSHAAADSITETLKAHGIQSFQHISVCMMKGMRRENFAGYPELARFKNTHVGESCFVIGNGPSLRMEDLTTLHKNNVFCFGSNRIFLAFDQTPWRPDVLCAADRMVLQNNWRVFNQMDESIPTILLADVLYLFSADELVRYKENINNSRISFFYTLGASCDEALTAMGENTLWNDITKYVLPFGTITIAMIWIALYMGFTSITLLGVDNTYNNPAHDDLTVQDHFIKGYFKAGEKATAPSAPEEYKRSYQFFEDASRARGFRVFNATRGGALEVFERVDFDTLFPHTSL